MNKKQVIMKAEAGEGLTVKEIKIYQKTIKPQTHLYGKYGTLAKQYLEERNSAKLWALAGDLPEYLHGVDRAAAELYDTMYEKLSASKRFQKTGDFLRDLQIEAEKQKLIEEEILHEIVYVD